MTEPAERTGPTEATDVVPFGEAVRTWFAIPWQTFGGPAGQIAVMERTLVEEKRWIGHRRFLHALNFCMLYIVVVVVQGGDPGRPPGVDSSGARAADSGRRAGRLATPVLAAAALTGTSSVYTYQGLFFSGAALRRPHVLLGYDSLHRRPARLRRIPVGHGTSGRAVQLAG